MDMPRTSPGLSPSLELCSSCGIPLNVCEAHSAFGAGKCYACYYEDLERVAPPPPKEYPHSDALLRPVAFKWPSRVQVAWFFLTLAVLAGTIALGIWEANHL